MENKSIWISWSYQRRSLELSKAFSATFEYFGNTLSTRTKRYLHGIPRTIALIHREKPKLLFVQNPSIFLALLAVLLKPIYGYTLVNDLHTPYIRLGKISNYIFWRLQRFSIHQSDMTLVTNELMKTDLGDGSIQVLPDKIPDMTSSNDLELEGEIKVLFVCTFAEDEPFEEVKRAAELLDDTINIYVTGNYHKAGWTADSVPHNMRLLGFIPEEDYKNMLGSVDIVMTLTSQPNCLVCGAYEGIAAGKPLILSNQRALKEYFSSGTVFVDNKADSIAKGINVAVAGLQVLGENIICLERALNKDWAERLGNIKSQLLKLKSKY